MVVVVVKYLALQFYECIGGVPLQCFLVDNKS